MYSVPSDGSLSAVPTWEPGDNAMFRTKSVRQQKSAKSAQLFKEITAALNNEMADFMSAAQGSDDGDRNSFKEEMMNDLQLVKFMLREETRMREAAEQKLHERFQHLELSCSAVQSRHPSMHDEKLPITKLHERMDSFSDVFGTLSERLTREMADVRHATSQLDQSFGSARALAQAQITACEQTVAALGKQTQDIHMMLAERLGQPVEKALLVANADTHELETRHDGLARTLVESPSNGPPLAICGSSIATTSLWSDPGTDADRSCGSQVGTSAMQDAVHSKLQACERQCFKLEEHCTQLVQRVDALDRRGSLHPDTDLSMQVAELTEVVQECFNELERRFRLHAEKTESTENQLQELMSFKKMYAQFAEELKPLLDCFEGALFEVTRNTALELKSTRDEIDQVRALGMR